MTDRDAIYCIRVPLEPTGTLSLRIIEAVAADVSRGPGRNLIEVPAGRPILIHAKHLLPPKLPNLLLGALEEASDAG